MSYQLSQQFDNKSGEKPAMPEIVVEQEQVQAEGVESESTATVQEETRAEVNTQQEQSALQAEQSVHGRTTSPADSFRELREAKKALERENAALKRAQDSYRYQEPVQRNQDTPEEDFTIQTGDNDLIEGKDLKRINSKVDKSYQKLAQELADLKQQTFAHNARQQLERDLPGFSQVVNDETLEMLKDADPDAYAVLDSSRAGSYATGKMAYNHIKSLGILPEVDKYANDKAKAIHNSNKPKPLTSISPQQGDTPLSKANAFANGLTDELKEQLKREMYAYRNN